MTEDDWQIDLPTTGIICLLLDRESIQDLWDQISLSLYLIGCISKEVLFGEQILTSCLEFEHTLTDKSNMSTNFATYAINQETRKKTVDVAKEKCRITWTQPFNWI